MRDTDDLLPLGYLEEVLKLCGQHGVTSFSYGDLCVSFELPEEVGAETDNSEPTLPLGPGNLPPMPTNPYYSTALWNGQEAPPFPLPGDALPKPDHE